MVLDLTRSNLLDSFDDTGEIPSSAQTFYDLGQEEYQKAIDALNAGDFDAAEEHALIAMTLFEDSASVIGEIIESESFGESSGIDEFSSQIINQPTSANIFEIQEKITDTDEEVENLRQLIESNNLDVNLEEYEESINLAKEGLANGDISGANEKLSIANEMKNEVYNQINVAVEENQDERIEQFVTNSISTINQMLANGEELGLSQDTLNELQDTLDVLNTGEIDEILEKTDDNSNLAKEFKNENKEAEKELKEDNKEAEKELKEDNKEAEKELKEDNKEAEKELKEDNKEAEKELKEENKEAEKELKETDPEAAKELKEENKEAEKLLKEENKEAEKELKEENKEAEKLLKEENKEAEKELKISKFGKVPPGLAKLLDKNNDESESPSTDVENPSNTDVENPTESLDSVDIASIIPDVYDVSADLVYSPDDYFEDAVDELEEDSFEENYDKMYKDSKAKVKKDKAKQAKLDRIADAAANGGPPGLAKKANDGITDGDAINISATVGVQYTVQDFTAIKNGKDDSDKIKIDVDIPIGSSLGNIKNEAQPYSFTPDVVGVYTITAKVGGLSDVIRVITAIIAGTPTVENPISDVTLTSPRPDSVIDLRNVFDDVEDADDEMTYSISLNTFTGTFTSISIDVNDVLTIDYDDTAAGEGTGIITVRATDTDLLFVEDSFDVTVSAAGNTQPTVSLSIPDDSTAKNVDYVILDIGQYFADAEDTDIQLTYTGTSAIISGDSDTIDAITSVPGTTLVTVDVKNGRDGTADITIRATDTGGLWIEDTFRLVVGSG
ncbi:hypothetical protein C5F49_06415 [Nitrosopumilus oxyclinae]|uniref:Uncharacterized protein n=2 Tax=Nitrosopumilus oxyclinae TaxID=1959104 RepID=A0A7D5M5E2_9ARCH|nr:hypothetical protein C5F49_06415 [Nitrosopumilus oxyclinae]